jgi:hypothetical protein
LLWAAFARWNGLRTRQRSREDFVERPKPGDECQIAGHDHGSTLAADLISDRLGSSEELEVKFEHRETLRQPRTHAIQLPAGSRLAGKRNFISGYTHRASGFGRV